MLLIQNITKTIGDKLLLADVSFKVGARQKVGLVGPNGAGKTTLLNIMAGLDQPDSGQVITTGEQIGYLSQKLESQPNQEVGEYLSKYLEAEWEHYKIDDVLADVGLKGLSQKTLIAKLSGGQKMKVGLAGLLLTEPTSLLLDEPTNNLDVTSLQWLENFVQSFPGQIVVISHDRFFLDACVNKIIELDPFTHQIYEYGGNYTAYKAQKQIRYEHQTADYQRQRDKEQHMKEWITEKQEQLKYHPSNKVARQLQAMKTRLTREVTNNHIDRPQTYHSFKIDDVGQTLAGQKSVVSLYDFNIHDLVSCPELHIFGQDRILLEGKNGAGKTTVLKSILGEATYFTGQIEIGPSIKLGYFSQEHEVLAPDKTVIDVFMEQTQTSEEGTARGILGTFLFTHEKVFSRIESLSEGEKARLLITILTHQNNDFLLLDEPTNHLDLESREILAKVLKEYEGGFVVVSHDRYFIEQIGINRLLKIKNGKLS
jgi:ATP-binding cassette, subfamily F, member 3